VTQAEKVWGNGWEVASFEDRFSGDIHKYIEWMTLRIELLHQKLKDTGTIFLHCDWHASHRLRLVLDEVFGMDNFRDEVVWYYSNKYTGNKENGYVKQHDLIFRYSKTNKYTFNNVRIPAIHAGRTTSTTKRSRVDGQSVKVMKRHDSGALVHQIVGDTKNQGPVFEIPFINSQAEERIGYRTQKPKDLLQRLILSASNPGEVVLDCFAGGFTTAEVCIETKRRFICGDVSPVACKLGMKRLNEAGHFDYIHKNMPQTVAEFREMNGHVFAESICELMGWTCNPKKSNDKGIDGWDGNKNPIQIKNQKAKTGEKDLRYFLGSLQETKSKTGIFVAWDFTPDAVEFASKMRKEADIQLRKCRDWSGTG
jgi:DNA modification methylase